MIDNKLAKKCGLKLINLPHGPQIAVPDCCSILTSDLGPEVTDAYAIWLSDPDKTADWVDACAGKALSPAMVYCSHREDLMLPASEDRAFVDPQDYFDYSLELLNLVSLAVSHARDVHGMTATKFDMSIVSLTRLAPNGESPLMVIPSLAVGTLDALLAIA